MLTSDSFTFLCKQNHHKTIPVRIQHIYAKLRLTSSLLKGDKIGRKGGEKSPPTLHLTFWSFRELMNIKVYNTPSFVNAHLPWFSQVSSGQYLMTKLLQLSFRIKAHKKSQKNVVLQSEQKLKQGTKKCGHTSNIILVKSHQKCNK